MTAAPGLGAEPVFILCNARSGSTLLRYLLDTHPDIACPAETKVAQAIRTLLAVHHDLGEEPTVELMFQERKPSEPTAHSLDATRDAIYGIASEYLERRGKSIWCDKSLGTVESLDVLRKVFPKARFICLHRHAMDVVASLVEACRWGYAYFDIQPYVARRYSNIALAFAEYWTHRTNIMLRFQQTDAQTYAVHYEHLVRDPVGTLSGILEFLGVDNSLELVTGLTESAFDAGHERGPSDWKVAFATSVERRSVERGRAVPQQLTQPVRTQMNALLDMLRYPVVNEDWNRSSDQAPRTDRSLLTAAPASDRLAPLVNGLLVPRLAEYTGPSVRKLLLVATHGDGEHIEWVIDSAAATIRAGSPTDAPAPLTVTTRCEVLQALLVGGFPGQSAQRLKMLDVTGTVDEEEKRAVARFLGAILAA